MNTQKNFLSNPCSRAVWRINLLCLMGTVHFPVLKSATK